MFIRLSCFVGAICNFKEHLGATSARAHAVHVASAFECLDAVGDLSGNSEHGKLLQALIWSGGCLGHKPPWRRPAGSWAPLPCARHSLMLHEPSATMLQLPLRSQPALLLRCGAAGASNACARHSARPATMLSPQLACRPSAPRQLCCQGGKPQANCGWLFICLLNHAQASWIYFHVPAPPQLLRLRRASGRPDGGRAAGPAALGAGRGRGGLRRQRRRCSIALRGADRSRQRLPLLELEAPYASTVQPGLARRHLQAYVHAR